MSRKVLKPSRRKSSQMGLTLEKCAKEIAAAMNRIRRIYGEEALSSAEGYAEVRVAKEAIQEATKEAKKGGEGVIAFRGAVLYYELACAKVAKQIMLGPHYNAAESEKKERYAE